MYDVEDTYINSGAPTTNYSNDDRLTVYIWPVNVNANSVIAKWNLLYIPQTAVVHNAYVEFYMDSVLSDGGDELQLIHACKIVGTNPTISACTWNSYDGVGQWTFENNLEIGDAVEVNKQQGYKIWNITNMVKDWISNPLSNYGMALYSDLGSVDTNRVFTPSRSTDITKLPRLTIIYEE